MSVPNTWVQLRLGLVRVRVGVRVGVQVRIRVRVRVRVSVRVSAERLGPISIRSEII